MRVKEEGVEQYCNFNTQEASIGQRTKIFEDPPPKRKTVLRTNAK